MYEIQIGGERLSAIGAKQRELKSEAAKVIAEEMKKAKGLVTNIKYGTELADISQYAARAYQHTKNAVAISATVDIPVAVVYDSERFMYKTVTSHPLYQESAEMIQLAIALEIIETNPYNWA